MIGLPDGGLASWNGKQVVLSTDGGTTWRFVGARMPYEPTAIAWSVGANTFYAAHADCDASGDNAPKPDSIRLDDA